MCGCQLVTCELRTLESVAGNAPCEWNPGLAFLKMELGTSLDQEGLCLLIVNLSRDLGNSVHERRQ